MKISKKSLIYIIIISILTIVTITLSVLLIFKEQQSYYDSKVASYEVQNTNLSKGQIVFIGDSITDLYPLDSYYSDLDYATYNRGIGGDTTSGLKARLDVSVFDLEPQVIIMLIGINDINSGKSVNNVISTYREIIEEINDKLPEAKLYCISVLPMNKDIESYSTVNAEQNNKNVVELNSLIKQLTNEVNATYLDLYSLVLDENGYLIKDYSDDGIHLNASGFVVWTNFLKPYLQLLGN